MLQQDVQAPLAYEQGGFLGELKRRRMYQAIAAYAAATFVVLQGAELLTSAFDIERFYNELVAVTLAGFPVALVLSWIYDVRQGRIRRTAEVADTQVSRWQRALPWFGLGFSILLAGLFWSFLSGS